MSPGATADALRTRFEGEVEEVIYFRDEVTAVVSPASIVDVCRSCVESGYDFLSDITCTDWLDRDPRFDVVYHLMSLSAYVRFRLVVRVNEGEPVPTVIPVWSAANWAEREIWDLFGVEFSGHPDLRRLLLPEGWIGFPLRKDYPQSQISLPRPKVDKVLE